jgi:hypothetical protein
MIVPKKAMVQGLRGQNVRHQLRESSLSREKIVLFESPITKGKTEIEILIPLKIKDPIVQTEISQKAYQEINLRLREIFLISMIQTTNHRRKDFGKS